MSPRRFLWCGPSRALRGLAVVPLAVAALAACSRTGTFPAAHPPHPPGEVVESKLQVGSTRIDLTPPPGPSTFGHGPDALATYGYWTRLYCRAFVFEPEKGQPFAIVPCDLPAISKLLQRRASQRVAELLRALGHDEFPASQLMITATHTHQGPGHYFENEAYGGFLSTRLPGFDGAMVDFLAERIALGVVYALTHPQPAAIRWVHDEIWGLSHNRSILAYQQNAPPFEYPERTPGELARALGHPPSPEERAVDPRLDVLEIERIDPRTEADLGPIGTLTFYAMHPTVMPAHTRYFGADAFGVASRVIERSLRARWAASHGPVLVDDPLAGIINRAEGDLVPNWIFGTKDECIRVGTRLGESILDRMASPRDGVARLRSDVVTGTRYVEAHAPGAPVGTESLCNLAVLGQSSAHGGADHPCTADTLTPNPPDSEDSSSSQSPKEPLLAGLQPFLTGPRAFEEDLPMAMARIDDTWISFVPAELTLNAGHVLDDRVLTHASVAPDLGGVPRAAHAVIAGLANAYIQYVPTAREYEVQAYEGGSDLYGPNTAAYLAMHFDQLAASLNGDPVHVSEFGASYATRYTTAPQRSRLPRPDDYTATARVKSRGPVDLCQIPGSDPPVLCFDWLDAGPSRVSLTQSTWLQLVRACGEPACLFHGGRCEYVDDRGVAFETRIHDSVGDAWEWTTLFSPTANEWKALGQLGDVAIRAWDQGGNASIVSKTFRADALPKECTATRVRECMMP